MKISKSQFREIIKEEVQSALEQDVEPLSEEQLDENVGAIVMQALKNPAVQKMLISAIMPLITKAMAGGAGE